MKDETISCRLARPEDREECVEVVCRAFAEQDPMTQAFGLTVEDMRPLLELTFDASQRERLSAVVITAEGRLAGANMLTTDDMDFYGQAAATSPKLAYMFSQLGEKFLPKLVGPARPLFAGKKTVTFSHLGVRKEMAGHGVANLLADFIYDEVKDRFDFAISEALNPRSAATLLKNGFVCASRLSYRDSGIPELAGLPGEVMMMVRDLRKK